jgi:hypothetical protein
MLEFLTGIINEVLQLHPILIALILIAVILIAMKVLKFVTKVILTGICFAIFPVAANLLGFGIPLTLQTILWFAVFGVIVYLGYHTVLSGYRLIKIVLSPFSKLGSKKPVVKTVIVKEKKEEDQ